MATIARATARLSLFLASTLCLAGTAAAEAAPAVTPPASEAAPALELDEVWVHGKRLADRIEEAEDAFFALYNELNDDDRFDVHCGLTSLQPGSMILKRSCVPGFMADRIRLQSPARYFRPLSPSPAVCQGLPTVDNGALHFEAGCYGAPVGHYHTGSSGSYSPALDRYAGSHSLNTTPGVPLELEVVHYREQYAQTVLDTIQGDARLQEKAADLSALYTELEATQQHYRDIKALTPVTWSMQRRLGSPGPR